MKKVFMIAPYEALSGNASGNQVLEYAENNNPAFEAPTGRNYARNYKPRYVISRRGDGTIYFSVKTKSATKITASSKMNMALLGGIAAIKSALKTQKTTDWNTLHTIYEYIKAHGAAVGTFNEWIDPYLRRMLRYHQESVQFSQAVGSVTITNPWNVSNAAAVTLVYATWIKFAPQFIFNSVTSSVGAIQFTIDGVLMYAPFGASQAPISWTALSGLNTNANVITMLADLSVGNDEVFYNGEPVYSSAGVEQAPATVIASDKYTTVAPSA